MCFGDLERALSFPDQDGHAVEFTYYGAASLAQIRGAMESADGSPLFADVRKVPASSLEHARP